jgi:hypothetical protein
MAAVRRKAKPTTVRQPAAVPQLDLRLYCKDLEDWPRSWMGVPEDLVPGQRMVACFRPFLDQLIHSGLARKTIRKHVDNLWILGGEIIRDLNQDPSLRKRPVEDLVFEGVDDGGLLPYHHDSEDDLRSFESTCRKFRRFLEQPLR